jgi:hypothetical protein
VHLQVLRRIATGLSATHEDNHILPVLQEISCEDMVFVIFPMFEDSFACQYEQVKDVFKGIIDVLEVRLLDHTSRNRLTIGFNSGSRVLSS